MPGWPRQPAGQFSVEPSSTIIRPKDVVNFPMTSAQLRRWLQAEIRWIQAHEGADDEQLFYDAAGILDDARQKAAALGLPGSCPGAVKL